MTAAGLATAGAMAVVGWGSPLVAMAGLRAGGRIAKLVPQIEVTALLLVGVPVWARVLRAEGFEAWSRALAATVGGPRRAVLDPAGAQLRIVIELLAAGALVWMPACLLDGGPSLGEIARVRLGLLAFAGFGIGLGTWASALWRGSGAALGACLTVLVGMAATPLLIAPVIAVAGARSELIQLSLLLNPWVFTAGLSGLDILRTQWVYALSPLGSLEAPYPGLWVGLVTYAGAGMLLLLSSLRTLRASGLRRGGRG